jgi:hypothetical protein
VLSSFNEEVALTDLSLISADISFSPDINPPPNTSFNVDAMIHNDGENDASDVEVRFSVFDPDQNLFVELGTTMIPISRSG